MAKMHRRPMPQPVSNNLLICEIRANLWLVLVLLLALAVTASSQEPPTKIRGYKVHTPGTSASNDQTASPGAIVRLDKPKLSLDGLLSVGIEADGEVTSLEQSGKVEFLTFDDIRVNGITVEIDEYRHKFKFKKGEPAALPAPLRGRISLMGAARTAWRELTDSPDKWRITGTVLVFGKFKRYGISFKRVVPVRLDLTITNPLR